VNSIPDLLISKSVLTRSLSDNVIKDISHQLQNAAPDERAVTLRRAPKKKDQAQPSRTTSGRHTPAKQVTFIDSLGKEVNKAGGDSVIGISPNQQQLDTWKINGIPMGATAEWWYFGDEPRVWQMRELKGCTATIILVCISELISVHAMSLTDLYFRVELRRFLGRPPLGVIV
jgi:hypothetical protein